MNPLSTTISPTDWLILTTGATIDEDGNVLIPPSALAKMCEVVDKFRGISKESSEKTRVKNSRKKRREIDERIKAEMLVILQREPNIAETVLSERIGLGRTTIYKNPELHAIYLRFQETQIVEHKFNNDPYSNWNNE